MSARGPDRPLAQLGTIEMANTVKDKVIAIIAEQAVLEVSDVQMTSTLEELGIDSLGLVESIFAIEEAFDIQVPFNANNPEATEFDISSVAAIVKAVEILVAADEHA
jgi:acyl carrier protein